ncbi:MAG: class I SAM-dependent methyltransferase [Burkholderiales bacterium]|nr:class I SAM-dependent methyltransferase [Burkholderiales bacterium]
MAPTRIADPASAVPGIAGVPPILRALAAHVTGVIAIAWFGGDSSAWGWLIAQGIIAAAVGGVIGLQWWWIPLNIALPLVVRGTLALELEPLWFLGAFGVLGSVYWTTFRTRVPLFLSNAETCAALVDLLPTDRPFRFLDIGCGIGTVLRALPSHRPNGSFEGVEIAPVPYLIARWRAAISGRFHVSRRDLWTEDLSRYDVVYAFLSPVPMADLWNKARAEMRPGTLLISNTFPVDGVPADRILPLQGRGRTLHIWHL